jgi:hypothetical protein
MKLLKKATYSLHTVNTIDMSVFINLKSSSLSQGFQWVHTTVFSKGKWDHFQSISEGSDSILFNSCDLFFC